MNGDQVVGVEDAQFLQKEASQPGNRNQTASDGWSQGDAVKNEAEAWK